MSMKKMRKATMAAMILFGCVCAPVVATVSYGQLVDEKGNKVESDTSKQTTKSGGGFYDIVFGSGIVGMLLWFALFGDGAMAIYFAVDCFVLVKPGKLMPQKLITASMATRYTAMNERSFCGMKSARPKAIVNMPQSMKPMAMILLLRPSLSPSVPLMNVAIVVVAAESATIHVTVSGLPVFARA